MARLLKDGAVVAENVLGYAGETSTFSAEMKLEQAGTFELQVLAMDGPNANFGIVTGKIEVTE